MDEKATLEWAEGEFGDAAVDARVRRRVVAMAARVAERPAGRVSEVFEVPKERQAAYDMLEVSRACTPELVEAMACATARRLSTRREVLISIDGSSVSVVDRGGHKGLGAVGSHCRRGCGVKLMNALAMTADGRTEGLIAQQSWKRARDPRRSARAGHDKRKSNQRRPTSEKETQHWLDAIDASERRMRTHAEQTQRTYVLDREGDSNEVLRKLAATGQHFVVRSRTDRRLKDAQGRSLRDHVAIQPVLCGTRIAVDASEHRTARVARMAVQVTRVTLRIGRQHEVLPATIVRTRELHPPRGEEPLEWVLITNRDVNDAEAALRAIEIYRLRWRVEEFHRTLKSGGCNAESTQLRRHESLTKWITILSAVAARIERLKSLARTTPDVPATTELSLREIRVLILMKRRIRKKTETITDDVPSIATATLWIAELGGYTGKSSGGPPGAITIARGLKRIVEGVELLDALDDEGANG